ncbi:nicotinate-nucleotide adenylyltransferase [Acrasis kona]|uniref:Nicotinate-nucleotide adenylyltransferase n=1 Tax=Acrasis kona TaxID=1008807 RepID=A0AAW2Z4F5_9EUKA
MTTLGSTFLIESNDTRVAEDIRLLSEGVHSTFGTSNAITPFSGKVTIMYNNTMSVELVYTPSFSFSNASALLNYLHIGKRYHIKDVRHFTLVESIIGFTILNLNLPPHDRTQPLTESDLSAAGFRKVLEENTLLKSQVLELKSMLLKSERKSDALKMERDALLKEIEQIKQDIIEEASSASIFLDRIYNDHVTEEALPNKGF